ncbi:hypothetical protein BKI52_00380 [marine bacterium AO1-C]|nr:hypothetical protein BKI52_00380 [marine bacterium AO1-C]
MKIIIKRLFIIGLVGIASLQAHSQTQRMVTQNANGTEEYLYFHYKADYFEYASGTRPKRIKLITIKRSIAQEGPMVHYVKFPGKKDVYKLVHDGMRLTCTNPNGSKQVFVSENKYISKGKNGLIEYLYTQGPPPSYFYNNNRNPKRIELLIVDGDMITGIFKVKFPGSPKVYKLEGAPNGGILCTNPDGSKQIFIEEK